jgi:hypothetical protein
MADTFGFCMGGVEELGSDIARGGGLVWGRNQLDDL